MQSYSQHHNNHLNDDIFDDDPNRQFNNLSSDIKLRRNNTDSSNYPILYRALSTVSANQTLVHNQRNLLAKNFRRTSVNDEIVTIDHNDADASFLLPDLYELPDDIRVRVMDSLVDTPTMTSLEETKRLNWWINKKLPCPRLYPLLTSGDGNCLLHATSLAMWGFHDHSLSMRKALNETLITSKPNNSLYRRWRWAQSVQNKKYGLVFSEQEWNEEWKSLLRLSSAEPRAPQTNSSNSNSSSSEPNPPVDDINRSKISQNILITNTGGSTKSPSQSTRQYYESLEEFHVYVLANNIRRPIIVYSDTVLRTNDGEAISPIEFGGIYLPLEIPPEKCHKQPVFLAFDAAHFSALVPMEHNSKPSSKATYRIPLIDIEAIDLLPIHYFVDPGPDFAWPIDEELSDDKIHLYTHYGESRMETLENYLNLSKELCSLNILTSPSTPTNNLHDDGNSSIDNPILPTNNETSIMTNETSSTSIPVNNKKNSRSSLNSFSKIIRRTFIEPFSSAKRASLKHQRQQQTQLDTISSTSITNENEPVRRTSSPLLNHQTNLLTIIVTNFQPKRPKTSDNMIKNYIDACMNEYRLEKNRKQMNDTSIHENDKTIQYSDWNHNFSTQPSMSYNRNSSSFSNNTNRYQSNEKFIEPITRKLPAIPINRMNPTTKNVDIDDNDDFQRMENGQFSSNINYVQPTIQRKANQLAQSNSQDMSHTRHRYPESYINGLSSNRTTKTDSSGNRSATNVKASTFQPVLQHQQSLDYDKNHPIQRVPTESNSSHRESYKTTNLKNNHQQPIRRSINDNSRQLTHFEQQHKRL